MTFKFSNFFSSLSGFLCSLFRLFGSKSCFKCLLGSLCSFLLTRVMVGNFSLVLFRYLCNVIFKKQVGIVIKRGDFLNIFLCVVKQPWQYVCLQSYFSETIVKESNVEKLVVYTIFQATCVLLALSSTNDLFVSLSQSDFFRALHILFCFMCFQAVSFFLLHTLDISRL